MPRPSEQPKVGKIGGDGQWVLIDPRPEDKYQECPWVVSAEEPKGWRDAWRVLRGRYEPRLKLWRKGNLRMTTDTMKEVWTSEGIEKELYSKDVFLNATVPVYTGKKNAEVTPEEVEARFPGTISQEPDPKPGDPYPPKDLT